MGRHGSRKNQALSACQCVTTLFEADSRLLICQIAPRESKIMRVMRDFYFLTPPCLPIEPLGELDVIPEAGVFLLHAEKRVVFKSDSIAEK